MTKAMAEAAAQRRWRPSYEVVFWVFFLVTTTLWTVDRFTTNYWPRQSFNRDGRWRGLGNDKVELKDGPASVQMYDVLARVSGRVSICTMNGLFFTMMHTTCNWLAECRRNPINMHGWQEANHRIHRGMGWITGVMMVPHVWSPFFPMWFSGWTKFKYILPGDAQSTFQFPVSELKTNCSDIDAKTQTVCFNSDNMGRLVGITIMFCVLFPLSRWARTLEWNWNVAKWLHVILAALYAFDIMRRRSHPHTWVLNLPVVLAYLVDRFVGWYYYRVEDARVTGRLSLGEDYGVVYWAHDAKPTPSVADIYWLKAKNLGSCGGGAFERLHPFTCVTNRHRARENLPARCEEELNWDGHVFRYDDFSEERSTSQADLLDGLNFGGESSAASTVAASESATGEWDVYAIVKIHKNPRGASLCCGVPQTPLLCDDNVEVLEVMGPYRSAYASLASVEALPAFTTLIASGSGAALLLDVVGMLLATDNERSSRPYGEDEEGGAAEKKTVRMMFTTRSVQLLQFVTDRLKAVRCVHVEYKVALTLPGASYVDQVEIADVESDGESVVVFHEQPSRLSEPGVGIYARSDSTGQSDELISAQADSNASFARNRSGVTRGSSLTRSSNGDMARGVSGLSTASSCLTKSLRHQDSPVDGVRCERLDIARVLAKETPSGSEVFFCGSPAMQSMIAHECSKNSLSMCESHSYSG